MVCKRSWNSESPEFPKHFLYGCAQVFPYGAVWVPFSGHDWSVLGLMHHLGLAWGQALFVVQDQIVQNLNDQD